MSEVEKEARSPEQIETEIEHTRQELGDTVEALAEKTDVEAQAKAKAESAKGAAQDKAQDAVDAAKQAAQAAPERAQHTASAVTAKLREDRRLLYGGAAGAGILLIGLIRRRRS
jgi:ElaB/YqjD/DUF883 family membrane-anchored ribosome-binding protein